MEYQHITLAVRAARKTNVSDVMLSGIYCVHGAVARGLLDSDDMAIV